MDYKESGMSTAEVDEKINAIFVDIVDEFSTCLDSGTGIANCGKKRVISLEKGIDYNGFLGEIKRYTKMYMCQENESSLVQSVRLLPQSFYNAKRIKKNLEIIKLQKIILKKYFNEESDENISKKVIEFKNAIHQCIKDHDDEYIDFLIDRFAYGMRFGLLQDLKKLANLMNGG